MGQIRRQAILSSLSIYVGFLVGALNTYLFVRGSSGAFTAAEYGLTRVFMDVGQMIFAFGSFGVSSILYKFLPYYRDNLARKENDLLAWCLLTVTVGFMFVVLGGWLFEPLIVRKFSQQSALFVVYYRWVFPFGLGVLFFSVLESYSVALKHSVFSTFLREGAIRVYVMILIFPYLLRWINFDVFIKLFALQYIATAIALWLYLSKRKFTHLTFTVSKVTRRFKKKMFAMVYLVYGGVIIQIVAQSFDGLLIMGFKGLSYAGIYAFFLYVANIIQVPQRSVQSVTIPHLSQAWKDKDMVTINRIYHRTSINLLIISSMIYGLIWLNYNEAATVFNVQAAYQSGLGIVLLLGIARIIDSGTGVNGQIIGTSSYWRFEFYTGVLLLSLRIPLNILLIPRYGLTGSAVADIFSLVVYNGIRMVFLARKFGMQPFTYKSGLALVFAAVAFLIVQWSCAGLHGWSSLFARSVLFVGIYGGAVLASRLTPDAAQLWSLVREKVRR